MAFPYTNLGAKVQLQIAGTWTDVTRYDTQTRILLEDGITINRGRTNVQDRTPTSTCLWTWLDPNGIYNNENPRSPYYGLIPRNTPVRVSVPRTTPALLLINNFFGANSNTADKAALQLTGDLDIRIEIEPRNWRRIGGQSGGSKIGQILASKWTNVVNGISWYIRLNDDGTIGFNWSSVGNNSLGTTSTAAVAFNTPRMAIQIQLDVDNGAGGWNLTFATASSINGTYTALGTTRVGTSTTAVYPAVGTKVELGTMANAASIFATLSNLTNFFGRIYAFQLRNGLGGALVASPDFTTQTTGTTSFSDGLGNTWANTGIAEITDADYRFYGELSAPEIDPDVSFNGVGVAVRTRVEAGGIVRRLTQNASPVQSTLGRSIAALNPYGWWTGGDGSSALTAGSSVTTSDPATVTDITFSGFDSTLPGSEGVMTLGSTGPYFNGVIRPPTAAPTVQQFFAMFKFPSVPLSAQTLFSVFSNGTVRRWDFILDATTYKLVGYDSAGTATVTKQQAYGLTPTNWVGVRWALTQSGGTVNIAFDMFSFTSLTSGVFSFVDLAAVGTASYAGTVGVFTKVLIQGVAALSGVKVSQIMTGATSFSMTDGSFYKYSVAYSGETADQRFKRVVVAAGMSYSQIGTFFDSQPMGPQPIDSLMNILYECAEVEGGIIQEARDQNVLEFHTRNALANQQDSLPLSYSVGQHLTANLKITSDDTGVANDITLNRKNGSSARATLLAGPMSIQPPPSGIGTVSDSPTINNQRDTDLPNLAYYRLGFTTWPEARYPSVGIALHRSEIFNSTNVFLAARLAEIGGKITISDLPLFMPAEPIQLMIQGTQEVLKNVTWDIAFNTTPYGPWNLGQLNTALTGLGLRAAQDSISGVTQTQLNAAVTSTATSLSIKTLSGPLLSTSAADFPADIFIGGERITISSVSGSTSPQTATVIRSVNGVVKAQVISAPVTVAQAFLVALDN